METGWMEYRALWEKQCLEHGLFMGGTHEALRSLPGRRGLGRRVEDAGKEQGRSFSPAGT